MKSTRGLIMVIVALFAGIAAVVFATKWLQTQTKVGGQIAVAAVDVELGAKLQPEMLRMVTWPAGNEPPGAFTTSDVLKDRVVKTAFVRGEPILEAKLAPPGTQGGLSAVVAEGKRAMTVRVNDVVGVAGFALPGNYVDIMVNTQHEGAKGNNKDAAISKIVLERILVLAIAQTADRDETKPKVVNAVTLEVSPQQAELLDLARSVGTLSLVLRNQVDTQSAETEGGTKATLLNEKEKFVVKSTPQVNTVVKRPVQKAKPVAPAPVIAAPVTIKSTDCIEVIRGGDLTKACF